VKRKSEAERVIASNRKALHDYTVHETLEVGLVLRGSEVKSLREGSAHLREAYVDVRDGELLLVGAHIAPYKNATHFGHTPERERRLLAHRQEIERLEAKVQAKGFTLIPLKLYWSEQGRAKLEVGLCKGKKQYDQRRVIAERDAQRHLAQERRARQRGGE
jgi:SsrA-binding protein